MVHIKKKKERNYPFEQKETEKEKPKTNEIGYLQGRAGK